MSGFSAVERIEVDHQYRLSAKSLHDLAPDWANRLRVILAKAEQAPADATLARVMVAAEIVRGIAADGRSPMTVRGYAPPATLSAALREAETLGRDLVPHVHPPKRGLLRLFRTAPPRLSRDGCEAIMRCRMIGAIRTTGIAARPLGQDRLSFQRGRSDCTGSSTAGATAFRVSSRTRSSRSPIAL